MRCVGNSYLTKAAPAENIAPGTNVRVLRRDRLGGVIHEYSKVALGDRVLAPCRSAPEKR